jgi:hypothetical protein
MLRPPHLLAGQRVFSHGCGKPMSKLNSVGRRSLLCAPSTTDRLPTLASTAAISNRQSTDLANTTANEPSGSQKDARSGVQQKKEQSMFTRVILAAVAGAFFGLATFIPAADAAAVCGPRDKVITELGEKFREDRRSLGLTGGSAVIELFVSAKGSWTLLSTDTKGVACLIAAGEAWQDAPKVFAGVNS